MAVKITTWILASSLYLLLVDWPSVDSCTYPPLIFALAAGHVSRYASLLRCDCRIRGGDTRLIGGAVGPTVVPLASLNMDHKHLLNHNAGRALCFFSGKQTVEFDALYPMFIPTCGRSRSWIIR
ncbi:hypothetical protein C6341_g22813 [Phytophthora cactorum]|nr:hypothetical protein C6341_g22813 [Phytophthora cactorum]